MRLLALVFALLFPWSAYAVGYGGAFGMNALGQEIHIADELANSLFVYWVDKPEGERKRQWQGKTIGKFKISEECPGWDWAQDQKHIVCLPTGKSPLAGATYRIEESNKIKDVCGNNAKVYRCIEGCDKPVVPKLLVEEPWEC